MNVFLALDDTGACDQSQRSAAADQPWLYPLSPVVRLETLNDFGIFAQVKELAPIHEQGRPMILRLIVAISIPVCIAQSANRQRMLDAYQNLPLYFEANQGQCERQVKFLAHGNGPDLFLTSTEALLKLSGATPALVRMRVEGGDPTARVLGLDKLSGESNYFLGNDPGQWRTHVPHFARVRSEQVYPGIDLIYYGKQRQIEFDFMVAPGADPQTIRLSFEGARPSLDAQGDLLLESSSTPVRLHKPVVYQEVKGGRKQIAGRFVVDPARRVSFEVARYDKSKALVIDPVLSYSTYLQATTAVGAGIAVDAAGNAYLTGNAGSNFLTVNPIQPVPVGAFVAKFNADASALIYSTFLGGSKTDTFFNPKNLGFRVAVDTGGNAYVVGTTDSIDFPTTPGVVQPARAGGADLFVAKLNPTGSALLYSTYLGGSLDDGSDGPSIALDSAGNAYVTGGTKSKNFPTTTGALQTALGGGDVDAFVTKLNAAGTALVYSTYLGGGSFDSGSAIAVDSASNAYVAGGTDSVNFPKTSGALQTAFAGGTTDAYVAKLNAARPAQFYSTYLGGSDLDLAYGIAVDSGGNAYVTGVTSSTNFPTTAQAFQKVYGGATQGFLIGDVFVSKISPTGTSLVYSTYLGGSRNEFAFGIAADSSGNAYVTGVTSSSNFPVSVDAFQSGLGLRSGGGTGSAAFLTKLNSTGTVLTYSTFFGGNNGDGAAGIALDPSGNAYLTGGAQSLNFPRTLGAYEPFDRTAFGTAFVAKFDLSTASSMSLGAVVNAASYVPGLEGVVSPGQIVVLFGNGIGPATLATLRLNSSGLVDTSLAGVRVLFDGTPAPLVYVSAKAVCAIVPYVLEDKLRTTVQVEYQGQKSNPLVLWVAPALPGIFTNDASGRGQGAILNSDYSVNSASNPADKGSVVVLFATGEGQTVPPGVDGKVTSDPLPRPVLRILAHIDNSPAEVLYAGGAPGLVAGVLQVNVRIPSGVRSGAAIPVTIGGREGPGGPELSERVTIAIR